MKQVTCRVRFTAGQTQQLSDNTELCKKNHRKRTSGQRNHCPGSPAFSGGSDLAASSLELRLSFPTPPDPCFLSAGGAFGRLSEVETLARDEATRA